MIPAELDELTLRLARRPASPDLAPVADALARWDVLTADQRVALRRQLAEIAHAVGVVGATCGVGGVGATDALPVVAAPSAEEATRA